MTIASVVVMTMAMTAAVSCTNAKLEPELPKIEEQVTVYDMVLAFQADGLDTATVEFYNDDFEAVFVDNISIPSKPGESVPTSFASDSKPTWVYTEGLMNTDSDTGMLRIDERSVRTKAGSSSPILLIIKKN